MNGDEYFIVEGLPNGAVINLPEDWSVDTDGRAVTVSDPSKVSMLSDEYGIKISGPCTITVIYSGIKFTARRVNQIPDNITPPAFKSASLLLSGKIGVDFFLDLPKIQGVDYYDSNKCYMDFAIHNDNSDNPPQLVDDEFTKSGRYCFRCYVNSVQMADSIVATFNYAKNRSVSYTYSVKRYLDNKITGSSDPLMRALAIALKDYGHYAQAYLARVNGWAVGQDHVELDAATEYTDSDIAEVKQIASQYATVRDDYAGTGIKSISYSLTLDTDTAITLTFTMSSNGNVFASLNDGDQNMAVMQSGGRFTVTIDSVGAHELGEPQNIMVAVDGAEKEFHITVSALTFVYNTLRNASAALDRQYLAVALYDYYQAAVNYAKRQ